MNAFRKLFSFPMRFRNIQVFGKVSVSLFSDAVKMLGRLSRSEANTETGSDLFVSSNRRYLRFLSTKIFRNRIFRHRSIFRRKKIIRILIWATQTDVEYFFCFGVEVKH